MAVAAIERLEDLAPGDVGAWVRLSDGRVGQVWALGGVHREHEVFFGSDMRRRRAVIYPFRQEYAGRSAGRPKTVWVADGDDYLEVPVVELRLADERPETGGLW